MRLYKVVILADLVLGIAVLCGYIWWQRAPGGFTREPAVVRPRAPGPPAAERIWSARGIVRGFAPRTNLLVITHEEIPGLMGPMTMPYRTHNPKLLRGLRPGDLIRLTIKEVENQFVLVSVQKEGTR